MAETKTLIEYGCIVQGSGTDNLRTAYLTEKNYRQVEEFVLKNPTENSDIFLNPDYHKQHGKVLKAQNYVGVLQTKDGTTIEILPKICGCSDNITQTKTIFLQMLKSLKDHPFKNINSTNLNTARLPIFEIFITMFLTEIEKIIKGGLKADYLPREENQAFLKGKLLFNQQIKHNLTHQERFFVAYDEFIHNRPENRLIKSTLRFLSTLAKSNDNQKRLREFIFTLDEIDFSNNIEQDFKCCKADRSMHRYHMALKWCRIFLKKESFTSFKGSELAYALMFDMNKVFENFVAHKIKNSLYFSGFSVEFQDQLHHLIEGPDKRFRLKPDIVLNRGDEPSIILDTKWKVVGQDRDISQADLYQMYAYGKKYGANTLILIYPSQGDQQLHKKQLIYHKDQLTLHIFFYDLTENEKSLKELSDLSNKRISDIIL